MDTSIADQETKYQDEKSSSKQMTKDLEGQITYLFKKEELSTEMTSQAQTKALKDLEGCIIPLFKRGNKALRVEAKLYNNSKVDTTHHPKINYEGRGKSSS